MARGTRHQAAAPVEVDEEPMPSSPALPTASVAGLPEDFERYTFLQSVIQKGFMLESEARDMYRQLTDSDNGEQPDAMELQLPNTRQGNTQGACLLQMTGTRIL